MAEILLRARALGNDPKAFEIYRKICMDVESAIPERVAALEDLIHLSADEGTDIVARWCDALPFYSNTKHVDDVLSILDQMIVNTNLESHDKLVIVVTQYNRGMLDRCYENFTKLLHLGTILLEHRVEACRYLFASNQEEHKKTASEYLISLINNTAYPSEWRYKLIANYMSKTGIGSFTNFSKLQVPYDKDYVCQLQEIFFNNEANNDRYRILSGQFLLDVTPKGEARKAVEEALLAIASNPHCRDGVRADAADVLIRRCKGAVKEQAQAVVAALGYAQVRAQDQTVYSDRQNVHNSTISKSVRNFIETVVHNSEYVPETFFTIHKQVSTLVSEAKIDESMRKKCFRSLDRLSIDTATFTQYNVGIADVFGYVWWRVKTHEHRAQLERRLLEELADMAETCSSGHTWRFVNVLSVYVENIMTISWEDQIKANLVGRIAARIRDIDNEQLKDQVSLGALGSASAEPAELAAYSQFVTKNLEEVQVELFKEFVEEGYVDAAKFQQHFDKAAARY